MKQRLKQWLHWLLANTVLRQGMTRPVLWGPYQGLRFTMSPPMRSRIAVFYRSYESEVSEWLRQHVKPGMVVCIVGGHVGIHVLYVARLLDESGQLVVFEGWPENYSALERNVQANPALSPHITLVEAAVSDQSTTLTMAQGSSDGRHHVAETGGSSAHTLSVTATRLDDYAAAHDLCPALILMDIEGHEGVALEGARQMLAQCKPTLLLEHHGEAEALTQWLAAYDYAVTALGRRHMIAE